MFQQFINSLVCGSVGGFANVVTGYPLDTIKTRMQVESVGFIQCIRATRREGGILTFFKGIYYPLISIPLINSISFSSYQLYRKMFGRQQLSFWSGIESGAFSGLIGCLIVNPVELLKCRMQADHGKFKNSAHCLHSIVKEQGLRALYKGMFSTVAREIPSIAGQFAAYEYTKAFFLAKSNSKEMTVVQCFLTGGIAGIGAWALAYPQDTVKTRLQVSKNLYAKSKWLPDGGFIACSRSIYRDAGLKGFFNGLLPCTIRAFVANAFMIVAYETAQRSLGRYLVKQ